MTKVVQQVPESASLKQNRPQASTLSELLALWTPTRRAQGGWWALAGFSFQSALYLFRFFRGISEGANSPTELARTELLSDITVREGRRYRLIQVKRTLDRPTLRTALREAYEIASMCEPGLLLEIDFQIACLDRRTTATPHEFSVVEVVGEDGDTELWERLLASFDVNTGIVVEPDPLQRLHDLLWHAGVLDPAGLVDVSLGILLRLFIDPSVAAVDRIALELNSAFLAASKPVEGDRKRIGILLGESDFASEPEAEVDHAVLFNRRPQLRDLRLGRTRDRPDVFSPLVEKFENWWNTVGAANERFALPIFWIDGRSGEGKSVLLLQLAKYVVERYPQAVVSYVRADDLPAWVGVQTEIQAAVRSDIALPVVAVVDDLHIVEDRTLWDRAMRAATDLMSPNVAILACGPTIERMKFEHENSSVVKVEPFTVPKLTRQEMSAFGSWYATRTGVERQPEPSDAGNRLLVIWMFELVQGSSIGEFAGNFKRRLEALQVFELAQDVLATNALALPAPVGLLASLTDDQRDAFLALCSESQLHFEMHNRERKLQGYRFSHPQIDWLLFCEWVSPPATIAQAWGRRLRRAIVAALNDQNWPLASQIVYEANATNKLGGGEDAASGTLDQLLQELRRATGDTPSSAAMLLVRWLNVVLDRPSLHFDPNPVDEALAVSAAQVQTEIDPYLAGWLWRIAELPEYAHRKAELRSAAETLLLRSENPSAGAYAASLIAARGHESTAALGLVKRWLSRTEIEGPEGYRTLSTFVAAFSRDAEILDHALNWLRANPGHPNGYHVIAPLLRARRDDDEIAAIALQWLALSSRSNRPAGHSLLESLVSNRPDDQVVRDAALAWINDNILEPYAYHVLAALVKTNPHDSMVLQASLKWLEDNPTNARAYHVFEALLPAWPNQKLVSQAALRWIRDNLASPVVYHAMAPLVAALPEDDEVRALASTWVEANVGNEHAYSLIATLVTARREDDAMVQVALRWLEKHSAHDKAYWLLTTVVRARREDDVIMDEALNWVAAHRENTEAYFLLAAMVAARPQSDLVLEEALAWLAAHRAHKQAYHLLAPISAAQINNPRVLHAVREWLSHHRNHPSVHILLVPLIKRSDGANEWVELGEELLADATGDARRELLLALLAVHKLDVFYLKRVMSALAAERGPKARNAFRYALSHVLARNVEATIAILKSEQWLEDRRLLAELLGYGLKRHPPAASTFFGRLPEVADEYSGSLLSQCLAAPDPAEGWRSATTMWMNQHYRRLGYGLVLRSVVQRPSLLENLLQDPSLSLQVREDLTGDA